MKNKLLIVCAFFCLSSCEGFLDLSPESQPNAKEFYVTENDFNSAVMACYQSLRKVHVQPMALHQRDAPN